VNKGAGGGREMVGASSSAWGTGKNSLHRYWFVEGKPIRGK